MSETNSKDPRSPDVDELSSFEKDLMDKLFSNPRLWPDTAKVWIADYVSQNSQLPIGQIQGFAQTVANHAEVATNEQRVVSASYGDLDTVGPQLSDLGAGKYLVMYGGQAVTSESQAQAWMSVDINDAGATDADGIEAVANTSSFTLPVARALVVDLPNSTNSIVCKYKRTGSGSTPASFTARWLLALRIANL